MEKWSGDGAGLKAITGGDAVSVDPQVSECLFNTYSGGYRAINNNPMRFTDRSGGVSRRRVILHFPEQMAPEERDPQLKDEITERTGCDCSPAHAAFQRSDERQNIASVAAEFR